MGLTASRQRPGGHCRAGRRAWTRRQGGGFRSATGLTVRARPRQANTHVFGDVDAAVAVQDLLDLTRQLWMTAQTSAR
jgi:hypothetical protein